MKYRLIFTIFLVILCTVGGITLLHFYFFRNERLRLVDRQIETSASILVSSDLSKVPLEDLEEAEEYFFELLGSYRTNKFILLRDSSGRVLYSSKNADWLPDTPPVGDTKWQTLNYESHTIRVLSVNVPKISKTLQVGMLLDEELFYWYQLDQQFFLYSLGVLLIVFLITLFLSHLLLSPLRNLLLYLNFIASRISSGTSENMSSYKSFCLKWSPSKKPDEFDKLALAVSHLAEKVGANMKTFQTWAAQMAHEMKTPLTIIKNSLETLLIRKNEIQNSAAIAADAMEEVEKLDRTITSFTSWVSLESGPKSDERLCAVSISDIVQQVAHRMEKIYSNRLQVVMKNDIKTFANPEHLEQAISNLVLNALKYSPAGSKVQVHLDSDQLIVENLGGGFPTEVLRKLGFPFNSSSDNKSGEKGNGLGLAWVSAVCKKYGWNFRIEAFENSTLAIMESFETQ